MTTPQLTISTPKANRKELAESFGQNQSAVRRLEAMTQDITVNLPDGIDAASVLAQQALALAQALQQVAYVVAASNTNVPNADVLQAGTGLSLSIGTNTITISLSVPVSVANGGTGRTSLTQHAVPIGNGSSAPNFAAPGTAGYVLTSNGASADPTFQALPSGVNSILAGTGINVSSATGNVTVSLQTPVAVANGGTGAAAAGGTALDNITGFSGTGLLQRTGAGAYSFVAASTYLQAANNLSDLASASTARTNLGLGTAAVQNVSFFLQTANNLSDLASASTARTNLGLGTFATQNYATPPALGQTTPNLAAFTYLTLNSATTAQADLQITNTLANGAQIKLTGNGATTPAKTIRVNSGVLQVMSNGYSAIMSLDDSGNLTVTGGLTMSPATTTTAPSAGGAGALPATPAGYATVTIGGTARKIAYY